MASPSTVTTISSSAATLPATRKNPVGSAAHMEALSRSSCVRFRLVIARRGAPPQHRRRAHAQRGGYYDQEDMYGPQEEYATLEPHDTKHENFLVLGPWHHGSWSSSQRHLGNLDYGEPIGTEYRTRIEARFFAHYLKDEPGLRSKTPPASKPAQTPGSITRTSHPKNRAPRACISRARAYSVGIPQPQRQPHPT